MKEHIEKINEIMSSAKKVHFIGAGGISVSSLASITKSAGYSVTGSDRTRSELTDKLVSEGIPLVYGHFAESVHGADIVVYTAAVRNGNPELDEAKKLGIPCFTRAEYLGWLMSRSPVRIGVAGCHGKSTVTAMISEIMIQAGLDPTVVCGAEIRELGGSAYRTGKGGGFVFEACEYCDSFLSFLPTVAVVTNVEFDHPDYFRDMDMLRDSYARYASIGDTVIYNADDAESLKMIELLPDRVKKISFGLGDADYSAADVAFDGASSSFTLLRRGEPITGVRLSLPGKYNVCNALAASAAALECGASPDDVPAALRDFRGVARRFEYLGVTKRGAVVYDDYAHHPTELRSVISAAKSLGKRLVCLFQPHTYSRTASLFGEFAEALSIADVAVLVDIYAAREVNKWNVSSEQLAEAIPGGIYGGSVTDSAKYAAENFGEGDMILILGAGDIIAAGKTIFDF